MMPALPLAGDGLLSCRRLSRCTVVIFGIFVCRFRGQQKDG